MMFWYWFLEEESKQSSGFFNIINHLEIRHFQRILEHITDSDFRNNSWWAKGDHMGRWSKILVSCVQRNIPCCSFTELLYQSISLSVFQLIYAVFGVFQLPRSQTFHIARIKVKNMGQWNRAKERVLALNVVDLA